MKHLVSLCLLLSLLLPVLTIAEDLPMLEELMTEDGAYMRRYTAPDGQEILYTSLSEYEYVYAEDVNFDGVDDLAALTMQGAANSGYTFFVSTENGYQLVMTDDMMYNYQLLPEYGAVMTSLNEGWAGSLCRMALYMWNGYELSLVRTAVSAAAEDNSGMLAMTVTDLTGAEPLVTWQALVPVLAEDAVRVELENMQKALTAGMPVISAE